MQWGDEGKGKLVDWLSQKADAIVRFQGGHNAGHTIVVNKNVYKLSLLPSGIVRSKKLSIIGNGVVLDPWHLRKEIETLKEQGVTVTSKKLIIAENTPLILPIHSELDLAREASKGSKRIGTTGRGIGPAYEDKVGRRAIRVADLVSKKTLEDRVEGLRGHHNALRRGLGLPEFDPEILLSKLKEIAPFIIQFAGPVWSVLKDLQKERKKILFEGAQGGLLDIDFGTYPFVTSSNVIAGQAATGSGLGPGAMDFVLGIAKAYTTRVGEGPFPTELKDATGKLLGEKGHEFGVVTGRKRRCGWFDSTLVRQMVATSGVNGIALTKLDVLDSFQKLKICIGYENCGKKINYLPFAVSDQETCVPIYEELAGWSEKTQGVRNWGELPPNAIKYVRRIEELIDCPVTIISTSPERKDTILITDPFADKKRE